MIVGIDVGYKIQAEVAKALGVKLTVNSKFMNGERICTLSHRLFHKGRLGRKTGIFDIQVSKPILLGTNFCGRKNVWFVEVMLT